jgi:cell division protein FtsI/penicillin-binding protein 2
MLGVVQSGTGRLAVVSGLSVAGKTGTAEFQTKEGRINRAWFIGFAPFEQPTVALAVVIEDGASGSHTAAPVAQQIFAGIFQKKTEAMGGGVDVD